MRNLAIATFAIVLITGKLAFAAEPVAATDGEAPGTSLQVQELKLTGGTLTLKFIVKNDSDKPFDVFQAMRSKEDRSVDGIYLIDAPGKKKYLVVRDSEDHCLCSRAIHDIEPHGSAAFWAKFPAPPDNVQKVGIVVPHFIPMDDVPISR